MNGGNDRPFNGTPQGPQPPSAPPLRPYLVCVRQITFRGDAEAIKAQLDRSLPDGLFLDPQGAWILEVETAPLSEQTPEWLPVVRQEINDREKAKAEKAQRGSILNPHTLRPVK